MEKPFIHLIADYGQNDPAFGEVIQRVYQDTADLTPTIYPTSVKFADTTGAGFWIGQYLLAQNTSNLFVYSNVAPRKEQKKAMVDNSGEGLKYARLKNGAQIVAVNSGNIFSFIKSEIAAFHDITVSNQGTQFRSRDNYVAIVAQFLHDDFTNLGPELDINLIPDAPSSQVAWIDGYGNIKTSIRHSQVQFTPGTKVHIELNHIVWNATYVDGSFSVHHGDIAFAPGSSGYDDPFMEIFLRRATSRDVNAADIFNHPFNGAQITIYPDQV